jgi:uncharacterized LabA/DUF88 family protein
MEKVRTFIYIDGFNLYYGSVKGTLFKWLDLRKFFQTVLHEKHLILSIKYFTALVSSPPHDPQKTTRQQTYLRALKHYIPEIEIYYGHFLSNPIRAPLVTPTKRRKFADVIKTEEKGSDVNLAVHLLNDAWLDKYDCAIVVSNDSDLAESMRFVKEEHHKMMGLFAPGISGERKISRQLMKYASFVRPIRPETLKASQLPDLIPGTNIHKPKSW